MSHWNSEQNINKNLNNLIWKSTRKIYSDARIVEIAIYKVTCTFNKDNKSYLQIKDILRIKAEISSTSVSKMTAVTSQRSGVHVIRKKFVLRMKNDFGGKLCCYERESLQFKNS